MESAVLETHFNAFLKHHTDNGIDITPQILIEFISSIDNDGQLSFDILFSAIRNNLPLSENSTIYERESEKGIYITECIISTIEKYNCYNRFDKIYDITYRTIVLTLSLMIGKYDKKIAIPYAVSLLTKVLSEKNIEYQEITYKWLDYIFSIISELKYNI